MIFRPHVQPLLGMNAFDFILDEFFTNPNPRFKTQNYPITDTYTDNDGNQVIEMALAGFDKKDIKISVKQNQIEIGYNSKKKKDHKEIRKIAKRSFIKQFVDHHNQLDFQQTKASFENGLLKIIIPQREEVKPIQIAIK
jgi:HSP20 family protein